MIYNIIDKDMILYSEEQLTQEEIEKFVKERQEEIEKFIKEKYDNLAQTETSTEDSRMLKRDCIPPV